MTRFATWDHHQDSNRRIPRRSRRGGAALFVGVRRERHTARVISVSMAESGGEAGVQVPLLPDRPAGRELNRTFGCVRYVYNRALEAAPGPGTASSGGSTFVRDVGDAHRVEARPELACLSEVSHVPLQQGLRHLQGAYANFFGKRAKYPTFKSKRKSPRVGRVHPVRVSLPRRRGSRWRRWTSRSTSAGRVPCPRAPSPFTVTVSRDPAGRWHVSILVEDDDRRAARQRRTAVGIDAGSHRAGHPVHRRRRSSTRSTRSATGTARPGAARLSRKEKGSRNRAKARVKVARVHARIADRRRDLLHKLSTRIIREKPNGGHRGPGGPQHGPQPQPGPRHHDASWSELRRQLEYKADWYGRTVIAVDRFYPSSQDLLGVRGHGDSDAAGRPGLDLPVRGRHDRDVNAAINVWPPGWRFPPWRWRKTCPRLAREGNRR